MEKKPIAATVEAFINEQPPLQKKRLTEVRKLLKKLAPNAVEKISYGMPTLTENGILLYYNAYAGHWALYAMPSAIAHFGDELAHYETSKGTIRFPIDEPVPVALFEKIVAFRQAENADKAAKRKSKKATK